MQEAIEHGGDKVHDGDLVLFYLADDPVRKLLVSSGEDGQACTMSGKPEEFPHAHVKGVDGFVEDDVFCIDGVLFLHPVDAVDQSFAVYFYAFWIAGRA